MDDFGVAVVAGCLEHGLFDAYVDFCPFEGLVTQYSFDVCTVRKKIERRGLEVVDPKSSIGRLLLFKFLTICPVLKKFRRSWLERSRRQGWLIMIRLMFNRVGLSLK